MPILFLQPLHIVLLLILLSVVIFAAVVAIRDAKRRGKSPLAVFLLVLAYFPLGLAIWLVFRPEPVTAQVSG
jgi:hypothetical protein